MALLSAEIGQRLRFLGIRPRTFIVPALRKPSLIKLTPPPKPRVCRNDTPEEAMRRFIEHKVDVGRRDRLRLLDSKNPNGVRVGDIIEISVKDDIFAAHQLAAEATLHSGSKTGRRAAAAAAAAKILEGQKSRKATPLIGVVLSAKRRAHDSNLLIRNVTEGTPVEIRIPIFSPRISDVKVLQRPAKRPRKANLYYLRDKKHDPGDVETRILTKLHNQAKRARAAASSSPSSSNKNKNKKKEEKEKKKARKEEK